MDGRGAAPSRRWRLIPLALRAGYGVFLIGAPERLLATGSGAVPAWAPSIARLLGARHVLQAAALAVRPQLSGPGALVDVAHASTDVACAAVRPALRGPALLDTGVAAALACLSLLTTNRSS